ncbi:UrcA family protein [Caulobacter sp. RL271]|jgi:UrcA family protein|uniref:UrcA family protein n=1 Tax=Caulobacter segnis TaxID=88688 RepID=A0ABY4ZY74_9CAUL|nr:UrcA family protein [Caulobacter segnis]USQ97579.1 UrcA family protein [Caulobacter segnis]
MSKTVNRIAAIAALALAATPIIGLTAAHAGERAQPVARIAVGDLRLAQPADAREFVRRVDVAAHRVCSDRGLRGLSARACRMDFAEDLKDAMTEQQAADLRVAQRAGANIALAAN